MQDERRCYHGCYQKASRPVFLRWTGSGRFVIVPIECRRFSSFVHCNLARRGIDPLSGIFKHRAAGPPAVVVEGAGVIEKLLTYAVLSFIFFKYLYKIWKGLR